MALLLQIVEYVILNDACAHNEASHAIMEWRNQLRSVC